MADSKIRFGLARIGQISITVTDIERATAFYRDTLGMKFLFAAPPNLAFFDCGGIRLMLGTSDRAELAPPGSILYYQVDDIEATRAALVERGVTFTDEPHPVHRTESYELWIGFFHDPDDNILALMCEKPLAD